MTARRSSGSIRAESAVELTRSENITEICRRSVAVLRGGGCRTRDRSFGAFFSRLVSSAIAR